jgi:cytoskeletal protein CcmA (bactofilin family)
MFSRKKQPAIRSLIGHGTQFKGNFTFSDGLRVDGHVIGNVVAEEGSKTMVVIMDDGVVHGEVRAGHVIVNGQVRGPVYATELLELQPKARVHGDVHYAALEMHQGAQVEGNLSPLDRADEEDKPALRLAASAQKAIGS